MRSPIGMKVITSGRVVVINSGFYRNVVGVIVKPGGIPPAGISTENVRKEAALDSRAFVILALVEKKIQSEYGTTGI
jgi:hypothetical protein